MSVPSGLTDPPPACGTHMRPQAESRGLMHKGSDRDLQMEIEDEMLASGRTGVTPRAGLIGAHPERSAGFIKGADADEPVGAGAEVAPTARAEVRERERHRLEDERGVHIAGLGGRLRQEWEPGVTREDVASVGEEADRRVGMGPARRRAE